MGNLDTVLRSVVSNRKRFHLAVREAGIEFLRISGHHFDLAVVVSRRKDQVVERVVPLLEHTGLSGPERRQAVQ